MSADKYGKYYWCIKVPKTVSPSGEIYVFADEVEITHTGDLLFSKKKDCSMRPNLAICAGKWITFFAASCFDGHAVAVEHWKGEVEE